MIRGEFVLLSVFSSDLSLSVKLTSDRNFSENLFEYPLFFRRVLKLLESLASKLSVVYGNFDQFPGLLSLYQSSYALFEVIQSQLE